MLVLDSKYVSLAFNWRAIVSLETNALFTLRRRQLCEQEIFSFALRSACGNAPPSVQCEFSVGGFKKLLFLGKQKKVGDSFSHLKLNLVQEVFKIFAKRKNLLYFLLWLLILLRITLEFF